MAEKLNLTVYGVRYHLTKMKKAGLIRFEGSGRSGQWVTIKNDNYTNAVMEVNQEYLKEFDGSTTTNTNTTTKTTMKQEGTIK